MKKEVRIKAIDYTQGELLAETERLDAKREEVKQQVRSVRERKRAEKTEREAKRRKLERQKNILEFQLSKPVMSGFVAMNMKSGKTRKVKKGEVEPMKIDHSDPSFADGDIVKHKKEVSNNAK